MSLGHRLRIAEVEQLRQQVAELEAENARLHARLADPADEIDLRDREVTRG